MWPWSPARRRDARLRRCFLRVGRAWGAGELDGLEPYATPWLCTHLREQYAAFAARGRQVHEERLRIERLEIVSGGGPADVECVARFTSTARHWVTGVATGGLETGTPAGERVSRYWRFVRDPERGWLADEIGVGAPPGWPPTTRPEPL
jgi:predicted lipid-binding transport protein (Tim44 family)